MEKLNTATLSENKEQSIPIKEIMQDVRSKVSNYLMPSEEKVFEIYCEKRVIPTIEGKTFPKKLKEKMIENLIQILVPDFTASINAVRKMKDKDPEKSPFLETDIEEICQSLWKQIKLAI